jgi:hypothetical protein
VYLCVRILVVVSKCTVQCWLIASERRPQLCCCAGGLKRSVTCFQTGAVPRMKHISSVLGWGALVDPVEAGWEGSRPLHGTIVLPFSTSETPAVVSLSRAAART